MTNVTAPIGLQCPVCRVDLLMSERQGIEIDYCPQCRGVWLDRGELDEIIERSFADTAGASRTQQPPTVASRENGHPDEEGHSQRSGHHGRRKGFLRELFD